MLDWEIWWVPYVRDDDRVCGVTNWPRAGSGDEIVKGDPEAPDVCLDGVMFVFLEDFRWGKHARACAITGFVAVD